MGFCHLTDSHHCHHGQKPTMVGICHGGNMPVGHNHHFDHHDHHLVLDHHDRHHYDHLIVREQISPAGLARQQRLTAPGAKRQVLEIT